MSTSPRVADTCSTIAHTFHAADISLYRGHIGKKILNRIAGHSNHRRSGGEQTPTIAPPMPRDPPVTSARLPFSSFGSFMKEIIANLRH
jgi:hypothetical protein